MFFIECVCLYVFKQSVKIQGILTNQFKKNVYPFWYPLTSVMILLKVFCFEKRKLLNVFIENRIKEFSKKQRIKFDDRSNKTME